MTPGDLKAVFAASRVETPRDSVGFLLWRVAHRYQREVDRVLAPLALTHLQFVVLIQTAWLARDGAAVTQAGLARYGRVSPMQLSNVLKTLTAKGLVARDATPGNARAKRVHLTAAAVALLAAALPSVTALQIDFFGEPAFGADLHDRLRQVVAGWGDED